MVTAVIIVSDVTFPNSGEVIAYVQVLHDDRQVTVAD